MKRNEILDDLILIKKESGRNTGYWENECGMFSSYTYLEKMKRFAGKYSINYDNDIYRYIESDESADDFKDYEYILVDRMAFFIEEKLTEELEKIIFNQ